MGVKSQRVVLADDHVLVRSGIRSLLEKIPGVQVVGEADDGIQALEMIETLQPDMLLADIAMRNLNGLEMASRAMGIKSDLKVIILSMHRNEEYVLQAMRAGCVGYLLKDSAAIELDLAVEAVSRGESYLSPAISHAMIDAYRSRIGSPGHESTDPLTSRQRDVLRLLAHGTSTKGIAAALGVSVKTVETHRADLMRRLDIHDIAGLVKYALRTGLIPPEG